MVKLSDIYPGGGGVGDSYLVWEVLDANVNALDGIGYLIDASSNSVTITLPATPTINMKIGFRVIGFANTIIIARNGFNIEGVAEDFVVEGEKDGGTFVYSGAAYGWVVVTEMYSAGGQPPESFRLLTEDGLFIVAEDGSNLILE